MMSDQHALLPLPCSPGVASRLHAHTRLPVVAIPGEEGKPCAEI